MTPQSFILIGHPVLHSISPAIHGAVYRHHGLPHSYQAVDCPDEASVRAQLERLRSGQLSGANVTVPWKRLALELADRADPSASDTGAANVLSRAEDGSVVAYNTDVGALAERLSAGLRKANPRGTAVGHAVVLGNGGAALAAVVACQRAGAGRVYVSARAFAEATPSEQWPHVEEFERLAALPVSWSAAFDRELSQHLVTAQLIVQATSAGMLGKGGGEEVAQLVPWGSLRSDVFVYDVVYNPPATAFLEQATALGLANEGGLSMLVGQAALAVELWLELDAPRAEMAAAAEAALYGAQR